MSAVAIDYTNVTAPVSQYTLCNASDATVSFTYGGKDYHIPPNGVLELHDRPGQNFRFNGEVITAKEVMNYAVGEDGISGAVGKRGVRVLFGDSRDELVWDDSRTVARKFKYDSAVAKIYAHEAHVKKFSEQGMQAQKPSADVREAYRIRDEYERDYGEVVEPFPCPTCNWGFKSQDALNFHQESMHKTVAPVASPVNADISALLNAFKEQNAILLQALVDAKAAAAPKRRGRKPKVEKTEEES